LLELLMSRRSIRHFANEQIDRKTLGKIVASARYAPTMNRRIRAIIVDDPEILGEFDRYERSFYGMWYRLFFKNRAIRAFERIFNDDIDVIKRKMEHSLGGVDFLYGAPALIILVGDTRTILTAESAQYHLASMVLYAHSLGLGACLMDSAKIALRTSRALRRRLGIRKGMRVYGAIVVGHPEERVLNLIEGMSLDYCWNSCAEENP
jgi:nitroreductase